MRGPTKAQLQAQVDALRTLLDEEQARAAGWRATAHKLSDRLEAACRRETRSWRLFR